MKNSLLILFLVVAACVPHVRADIIFDVRTAAIPPGGSGVVDVYIHAQQNLLVPGIETENIALFNYRFRIESQLNSLGQTPAGELYFRDSFAAADPNNPARQNNQEQLAADYIFAGSASSSNFVGNVAPLNQQLDGSDFVLDAVGDPVNFLVGETPRLLARLEVAQRQTPRDVGDVYRIVLDQSIATQFFSADGSDVTVNYANSNFGRLTVGAASVPEPNSMLLSCLATIVGIFATGRRKR